MVNRILHVAFPICVCAGCLTHTPPAPPPTDAPVEVWLSLLTAMADADEQRIASLSTDTPDVSNFQPLSEHPHLLRPPAGHTRLTILRSLARQWQTDGIVWERRSDRLWFAHIAQPGPCKTGILFARTESVWKFAGWAPGIF